MAGRTRKRRDPPERTPAGSDEWMATYADMVTLLLCFFILLYAIASEAGAPVDRKKLPMQVTVFGRDAAKGLMDAVESQVFVRKESNEQIISKTKTPGQSIKKNAAKGKAKVEDLRRQIDSMVEHVNDRLQSEALDEVVVVIKKNNLSLKLLLPNRILFKPGRAELKQKNIILLQKIRTILHEISFDHLIIEGHTDTRPLLATALYRDNWELSTARSGRVVDFLTTYDIDKSHYWAEGRAYTQLLNTKNPFHESNRRIEIHIYVDPKKNRHME